MEQNATNPGIFGWWKKVVFENYANFEGRARRAEYWYFMLATIIMIIPFYVLIIIGAVTQTGWLLATGGLVLLLGIFGLIVPSLAVTVRRLHDINKSGWYYFIAFIPFVGGIISLVWHCTEGTRGANDYGEDPKNPEGPVFDFEVSK